MTVLILTIYCVLFFPLFFTLPAELVAVGMRAPIYLVMAPIFFIIALLFYRIPQKIAPFSTSRHAFYLISTAWLLLAITSIFLGLIWLDYLLFEVMIQIFQTIALILILYGMVIGKVITLITQDDTQIYDDNTRIY